MVKILFIYCSVLGYDAVEAVGISCNLIFGSLHVAHAASVQFIAFASNLVCYYLIISFIGCGSCIANYFLTNFRTCLFSLSQH